MEEKQKKRIRFLIFASYFITNKKSLKSSYNYFIFLRIILTFSFFGYMTINKIQNRKEYSISPKKRVFPLYDIEIF